MSSTGPHVPTQASGLASPGCVDITQSDLAVPGMSLSADGVSFVSGTVLGLGTACLNVCEKVPWQVTNPPQKAVFLGWGCAPEQLSSLSA